ncbi:DNA-3-methyladenine glycosylase [Actinoplanes siamensis]|uniref:Putative 3-methyladenine DNA glycosylase n=1 Tax=Actinoplanes siamensis TaxID=1223317 RepID=A0A919NC97_9ACTN|nr:DNA-3-methyladenine glycosylase [Actinoplanes siamensis]GIF08120.1 putative 3-methyladenine DNA glycosylase [Actinoplanes siamensis]
MELPAEAVDVAARELLGWRLAANGVTVRLTEVEAYSGLGEDPASHAHRGVTNRNAVMFGPAGRLYVYQIYGMHFCANIVCGEPGRAAAVLLRAGEVVDGLELARSRRPAARRDHDLAAGPAKLMQVLSLNRAANDTSVVDGTGPATLTPPAGRTGATVETRTTGRPGAAAEPGAGSDAGRIEAGPRVGVTSAHDVPWRFWFAGDPTVSAYRRHTPGARRQRIRTP